MDHSSSTHSSPRSFHSDLSAQYYPTSYPHYTPHPHHSHTYPIPNYPTRATHKSTLPLQPISLSVSTETTPSEHDPNEKTARPHNAHKHAQFLSGALTSNNSEDDPEPARSLLFSGDLSSTSDDPGATPVVAHPPSTTSAAGLPTPLNSVELPSASLVPGDSQSQSEFSLSNTPGLSRGLSRPLTAPEQEKLAHLDRLKFFLATAPSQWDGVRSAQSFAPTSGANTYPSATVGAPSTVGSSTGWGMGLPPGNGTGPGPGGDAYAQGMHPSLNRFMLPSQEFVTCVLWNGLYHITGTDIVRALVFRFEAFGRPVRNMKKFEEGVFSDLRNLKPGVDACLEEPKSPFLDLLFKYQCIRTQKKQKVFYWFSVPHDRLFLDALERDLKREKMGLEATTQVVGEPAMSFTYDPKRSLYEQFAKAQGVKDGEGELESAVRKAEQETDSSATGSESDAELLEGANGMGNLHIDTEDSEMSDADDIPGLTEEEREKRKRLKQEHQRKRHLQKINGGTPFFSNIFGLFEGSPTYKQRRKKNPATSSALSRSVSNSSAVAFRKGSEDFDDRGRPRSMGGYGSGLAERHPHPHSQSASASRERSYPYPQSYVNRPFPFASMTDEFGPGSMDYRERSEPNAAEMFHKQARQELVPADGVVRKPKVPHVLPDVGVLISEGFTAHQVQQPQPFTGQPTQLPPDVQQPSSQLDSTYPGANGFDPTSGGIYPSQPHTDPAATQNAGTTQYETLTPDGKFRAFMCPLYSCGRLFKRMEHLKRHLRTHTMERPFMCPICQKRFSRSDNLNQHLRTHERTGSALNSAGGNAGNTSFGGAAAGMAAGGIAGAGMDMNHTMGLDMSMGMWRDANEESDFSGTESEFDEEGFMYAAAQQQMVNDPTGMFGMGMMNSAALDQMGAGAMGPGGFNMQMCEIEVQAGDVREIAGGEEEGLLLRTGQMPQFAVQQAQQQQQQQQQQPQTQQQQHQEQNAMYATGNMASVPSTGSTTDFGSADTAQWATRPQPSPGFSGVTVPSPPSGNIPQIRSNRSSMNSSPAGYMRPTHSASSSTSSLSVYSGANGTGDDYVTSMSAPSHKQAFDQGSFYPPGMLDNTATAAATSLANAANGGNNGGPIRRHRSMTPNLGRNGEPIRRPLTANSGNGSNEFPSHSGSGGSPGSGGVGLPGASARGYHPYASGYASSSRSGSTHSSPAVYSVPLDGTQQQQAAVRRPDSRAGFTLQEQMQMMHQQQQQGENMFRTESPASFHGHRQTESPAPYPMELPNQVHPMYAHSNTVPVGVYDSQHQQQQQQQLVEGGFYPQQHSTL